MMIHNTTVKISEILHEWNLLKTCIPTLSILHNLQQLLLWENENSRFFLSIQQNKTFGV